MSFGVVDGELHVVKAATNAEAHPSEPVLAGDVLVGVNGAPATIAVVKKALLSSERPLKLAVRRVATFAFGGGAASVGGRSSGGDDVALALSPVERAALAGAAATQGATLPLASLTKEQVLAFARHHEVDSLLGGLSAHKVDGLMLNDVEELGDLDDFSAVKLHKKKLLRILTECRVNGVPSAAVV